MTTDTTTLTAFLLARFAEDEAVARVAAAERVQVGEIIGYPIEWPDHSFAADFDGAGPFVSVGADRVLAECAAKRRIVEAAQEADRHEREAAEAQGWDGDRFDTTGASILRALASVYRAHPGWRAEWDL